MIVDQRVVLAGGDAIATRLLPLVDEHLSGGPAPQPLPPPPAAPEPRSADRILVERVEQFTLVSVIIAGLVDGINPCAISTLVFLISVLSLARARGSRLLAVGAAFCLASFLTYSLIGLGLLHAFRALAVFRLLQKAVDAILIALLAGLAFFSFRDAVRFARSHDPHDVSLQLPEGFKVRIHRMMRAGLGRKAQLTTAFGIGAAVTMLESVCTGQVYVPTLAFVVRSGQAVTRGLGYLALYNLMFVLPLVAVFGLTFGGMKVATLVEWSSRNVIFSKLLLGLFFLALAGMMLVL
jgi:hypothetical protein